MVSADDRLAIHELLVRYTVAIDTGDWDRLDTVFEPTATIDYTASGGIKADYPAVRTWLAEVLPAFFPRRMHLLGQISVEESGPDEAVVMAYFYNPMVLAGDGDSRPVVEYGGFYHHTVVRTPQGWRSRGLREEIVFSRGLETGS